MVLQYKQQACRAGVLINYRIPCILFELNLKLRITCAVVVLTCFVKCGCFGNMCTCIVCTVSYCVYCILVLFRLCILILICFVCTGVRTTATE